MTFRDAVNNELKEGDVVSLAVGNELGVGTIVKTTAGLALQGGQPTPPMVFVQITVSRQCLENGIVLGVLKTALPDGAGKKLIEP